MPKKHRCQIHVLRSGFIRASSPFERPDESRSDRLRGHLVTPLVRVADVHQEGTQGTSREHGVAHRDELNPFPFKDRLDEALPGLSLVR